MISTKDSGILIDSHLLLDAFSLFLLFCAQTFRFIWFIIQNSSFFNVIKPFIFCQVESGLMFLKPNLLNGADFCEWSPRRPLKSRLSAFTRGLGLEPPLTTVPHLQDQSMNAPAEWCRTLSPQRDDLALPFSSLAGVNGVSICFCCKINVYWGVIGRSLEQARAKRQMIFTWNRPGSTRTDDLWTWGHWSSGQSGPESEVEWPLGWNSWTSSFEKKPLSLRSWLLNAISHICILLLHLLVINLQLAGGEKRRMEEGSGWCFRRLPSNSSINPARLALSFPNTPDRPVRVVQLWWQSTR